MLSFQVTQLEPMALSRIKWPVGRSFAILEGWKLLPQGVSCFSSSASISSMLGKLPCNGSGSDLTSLVCHSATPIGLAMSRRAYSAMTRSRVLQRISPIVGTSEGCDQLINGG